MFDISRYLNFLTLVYSNIFFELNQKICQLQRFSERHFAYLQKLS